MPFRNPVFYVDPNLPDEYDSASEGIVYSKLVYYKQLLTLLTHATLTLQDYELAEWCGSQIVTTYGSHFNEEIEELCAENDRREDSQHFSELLQALCVVARKTYDSRTIWGND